MFIRYQESLKKQAEFIESKRKDYMYTKFTTQEEPKRAAGRIRGLIVEQHITDFFKTNYPENYKEADNFEQWEKPCNHDFKLELSDKKVITIDVSGPQANGKFGSYPLKPKGCDFHIIARIIGMKSWDNIDYTRGFQILGVCDDIDYNQNFNINKLKEFGKWIDSLNLKKL